MEDERLINEKALYYVMGILEKQNIQYNKQLVPLQFQGLKLSDQILKRKSDFRIEPRLEIKDVINKPEFETKEGVYKGQWKSDKKNGRGQLLYKDGTFVQGYWKNDFFIYGQEYRINDNQIYEGAFENGKYNGQGTLSSINSTYMGDFKNGLFDGEGELIVIDKQRYKGQFKNGKKHGKGIFQDQQGKYEGEFENDKKHGQGIFYFPNQDRYEGSYFDDVFHGKGLYKYHNGDYYDGLYVNGVRQGYGLSRLKDRLYEGNLINDQYDGKVKLTMGNKLYECLFKNGTEDQNRRERIE